MRLPPLLLITDRRQALRPLADIVEEACTAGCRWISLREKDSGEPEQIALARQLQPIARRWIARLTLHGSAALALAAQADGVHLPAGGDASAARALLGGEASIGRSVHQAPDAARLDRGVLDYLIAGPAYATASKPGYGPALGPAGIAAIAAVSPIPVLAVGGIEPGSVPAVMRAGAAGIAVMGSVMRSAKPGREIERLLAALTEHAVV